MTTVRFDMVQTVAVAGIVLFLGHGIRQRVGVLQRFGIPAAVVGGLVFAALAVVLRRAGVAAVQLDTTLQAPLMLAWFTTIGLGAGFVLLKPGRSQALILGVLAAILAAAQNGIGVGLAALFGVDPLVGLIAGSITMTGGHAMGAAFGTLMENELQLQGAVSIAMTMATLGLVAGVLVSGPLATCLLQRRRLPAPASRPDAALPLEGGSESGLKPPGSYGILKMLTLVLVVMWAGGMLSVWLTGLGLMLPGFIAATLAGVVVRNALDLTRATGVNRRAVEDLGTVALSLFLVLAMMSLESWDVSALGVPLAVMLGVQVTVTALFAGLVTFRAMGRDYDAAVMAAGTVVPTVGVFFTDVTNGIIITTYLNLVR